MIIWKGWGILAVVYIGAMLALLGGVIGTAVLESATATSVLIPLGLLLGGVMTAAHGWYLNNTRPARRADAWAEAERPRLQQAVDQGTLVVDNVRPASREQAQEMMESVLERGRRSIKGGPKHSVFWIPMEIIGIIAMGAGLIFLGMSSVDLLV